MRILNSFIVRAICAAITGYLLVMYRTEMVQWLTIAVGALFFISGVFSLIFYYSEKLRAQKVAERLKTMAELRDGEGAPQNPDDIVRAVSPSFPIVGVGSIILGAILGFMPSDFVKGTMYALSALLILGGISQIYNLVCARRLAHIPWPWWVFPVVVAAVGVFMVARPMEMAALPFRILGWGLMLYAVVEIVNGIQIFRIRRRIENATPLTHIDDTGDIEEAEIVE
ncbi:MAG: DUF308 domain-containing protein [Prevotella sp.]|nr:DUF308 domain-containing protein [Prevotella sp.]